MQFSTSPKSKHTCSSTERLPALPVLPHSSSNSPHSCRCNIGWCWWMTTAPHLSVLLNEAGYTLDSPQRALLFHYNLVTPWLGPCPNSTVAVWKSFMTDDHSPIEYSWKWTRDNVHPEIRYSVEAISHLAGTEADPSNQRATLNLLDPLVVALPKLDLTLFWHLWPRLVGAESPAAQHSSDVTQTTIFVAFEINNTSDCGVKIYFLPRSTSDIGAAAQIFDAIQSFNYPNITSVKHVEAFLQNDCVGKSMEPFMLGIDCVHPFESRLKVYARSPLTSFSFVKHVMSLGGQRAPSGSEENELKDLWYRVLGLPRDFPISQELPACQHQTAGILFYFDVGPKTLLPDVKVYIPVRHYGKNDAQIMEGLTKFQREHGRGRYAEGYVRAVQQLSSKSSIEAGTGTHTYISASYKDHSLVVTSYLSPQLYRQGGQHGRI